MQQHPDTARILKAIGLGDRPGLYVQAGPATVGHLTILQTTDDPEDGEAIVGLAVQQGDDWYLGCINCEGDIKPDDAGMCEACRVDAALREQETSGAYETDESIERDSE